jgi:hypothetical protein
MSGMHPSRTLPVRLPLAKDKIKTKRALEKSSENFLHILLGFLQVLPSPPP